ncbi:TorF family putative porin [Massilia pinisoli]|uniref:TorF family putative porin n=1 Tax=Massilia pinisoli TaxID=1772194 RepID=A0ABT1ZQT4_9BURK|nr:TorF family putative porin [Massilia pinisoli]MCS0582282.1 TorF family putative porin [Massilia pinisoli]
MPFDRHDRQSSRPAPALTGARPFFLVLAMLARGACAQTSAEVSLVSEYAMRGISLNPDPALQLRVDHDADGGWYTGAFASPIKLYGRGQGLLIVYGGRAAPLTSRLSWDAGIARTIYLRNHEVDYHEFYAGLTLDRVSARLSYSPAYFGAGRTVYLDVNTGVPLGERISLALHGGILHPFADYRRSGHDRADLRAALAYDTADWRLQAGWQTLMHPSDYERPRARALFASASLRF